ncbi:hypothetical protein [Thorsellia anophelis]|uniref:Chaperone TorD involved in molybdoenzyme TorA maturation n=1 Tax=Thorsellia anophelis DSM 18579 TaxID=1123402 RepID=A0A1I0C1Y0_9GAMM|nr:hypothetical protein [Thorsellia anophelis]SET12978.1 chaperone TorD involved in molybdoenzyme TorA maturation [Thorsellia anophelis DSM 18579]
MQTVNPQNVTELSAIMRILGNLYYRHPSSQELSGLYDLIKTGKLYDSWPIEQAELFKRLEKHPLTEIAKAYDDLFNERLSLRLTPELSEKYQTLTIEQIKEIVATIDMPVTETTDYAHYGFHWLILAWIETTLYHKQSEEVEDERVEELQELMNCVFSELIEPFSLGILGKIEAYTDHDFYKVVAMITREVIVEINIILTELEQENS